MAAYAGGERLGVHCLRNSLFISWTKPFHYSDGEYTLERSRRSIGRESHKAGDIWWKGLPRTRQEDAAGRSL
jgi:hypothetical protein